MNNINDIVTEIYNDTTCEQKYDTYDKKYPYFFKQYPFLAKNVCEDENFDMTTFKYMLEKATEVNTNKASEYDAAVSVGEVLANVYIKPKIKHL
jgi:hypothetical protein